MGKPLHRRYSFWLALVAVGGGGAFAWGVWAVEKSLPDVSAIASFAQNGTLTIKAADGVVLQQLGSATRQKLTIKQVPDRVIKAFIAAEDRRFYQHNGVDYQSIVRAVASNLLARDFVEGGSTITQQVARIIYLNQDRTMGRKIQEAFLAQKIERALSKDQVLEKYLNLVYLGSGAYGVADAAWVYFSKSVDQLTLSETATIAGLPPAPSDYSPLVNPQIAQQRRDIVLDRMQESGYITEAEVEQARAQPLALKPSFPKKLYSDTPYFTSYVQQQLPKLVSKEQLEAGGLTVETSLNTTWQKAAEKAIKDAVKNVGPAEGFKQASLVAVDPRNGEIRAMVGGTDFVTSQFNRVTQAQRQPGSSFKPILYTTAIATGISPYASYLDAPLTVDGYKPQNYGRKYSGWLSLRSALTNSVNLVSVRLLIDVGFDPVIKLGHDMGIQSELLPTYSLALGASEVNLLEITTAYATLAARGNHMESHGIRRIINRRGEVIYTANVKPKRVIDQDTVAIVTWMMQNVVNSGTGQAAQIGRPVAGKTGTSEEARDLWFIGFVPQMAAGVWLGNDDNTPTWSYSSTAAEVWHNFMTTVVKGMPVEKFAELPKLDNRKGVIKAKPVKPAQMYDGEAPPSSSGTSDNSRSYPKASGEPARTPAGDPNGNAAPAAPDQSPAPAAPETAPPPQNTAPELPPAEPAPPPTTSGPPPSAPAN
ncbi:penicillin-binding protein [Stenomitos frigidus ULC18]|uniref:Penicillin-binding protein n=2 Tax=Stenomitos TaxID=1844270 RepID=A0A2T1EEG2_9CYAN|nr:penicillin-binding protein [Stenomitos frigidus ULC18]